MQVHPSGYYAWKAQPESSRAREHRRLLGLIKQSWLESGGVYGYRKITADLRDLHEFDPFVLPQALCDELRIPERLSFDEEKPLRTPNHIALKG